MVVIIALLCVLGFFGSWIAKQKKRSPVEGFILGFAFGPLGIIVEAVLPNGTYETPVKAQGSKLSIDDQGLAAFVADRYRTALDEADPFWSDLSPTRKRAILKPLDRPLQVELKLTPTKFSEISAVARRQLFEGQNA